MTRYEPRDVFAMSVGAGLGLSDGGVESHCGSEAVSALGDTDGEASVGVGLGSTHGEAEGSVPGGGTVPTGTGSLTYIAYARRILT